MQVYATPESLPAPQFDIDSTADAYDKLCDEHSEKLKTWLKAHGYPGANTGKTVRFSVADGYAVYMLAEGKKSMLVHLDYWDGYNFPEVKFLPKKEILARIKQEEELSKLFGSRKSS